jgi:flavorubredoxin
MPQAGADGDDGVMTTTVHEIADGIYRLSTYVADIAPPAGFTFNQFLVDAEEPLLFHCGPRALFPDVSAAAAKVVPLERLRWVSFGHVEADECGSMNQWLAAAPNAQVTFGGLGCMVSLNDLADRPPRPLADGERIDLGGKRIRQISTPHVPHAWEAQLLFEETTATLLCGDLFAQVGDAPALVHGDELVAPALESEDLFQSACLTPNTAPTIRGLADLEPRTLALMHGPSFVGDCVASLHGLAAGYDARFTHALESVSLEGSKQ